MILEYTQMDAAGTRTMHVLGTPVYLVLLASIWLVPYGVPFVGFLVAVLGALVYQFLYCKSLYAFVHGAAQPRPFWQFAAAVVGTQFLGIAALYVAA
ncbi:hypothetical protein ACFFGH_33920 [Lysobacter korlensis]|uniref:Uncharacterized protein n=1 Tax=Lysobacter korlensis TaxID=553636 RepID=A0ABV6S2A6_9GAMM